MGTREATAMRTPLLIYFLLKIKLSRQEDITGFVMTRKQVRIVNSQRMKTQDVDLIIHTVLQ